MWKIKDFLQATMVETAEKLSGTSTVEDPKLLFKLESGPLIGATVSVVQNFFEKPFQANLFD